MSCLTIVVCENTDWLMISKIISLKTFHIDKGFKELQLLIKTINKVTNFFVLKKLKGSYEMVTL
jgi:hypothetical protein